MKLEDLIRRVDELLALGDAVLATQSGPSEWGNVYVDKTRFAEFRSASLSCIDKLYSASHPYYTDFDKKVVNASPTDTSKGKGILQAVRGELQGGWLHSLRGLVASELFADFIEMSEYLLGEGYKDAAAVMVGSVLEEHLRQLCTTNGIAIRQTKNGAEVFRKADSLNADLAKAQIYKALDQKNVTAWLDLRNKAAHGHYNEYTPDQVKNMLSGVSEFVARVSL